MQDRHGRSDRRVDEPLQVEVELLEERAAALGSAGRKLEDAVTTYRTALAIAEGALPAAHRDAMIDAIAAQLYRLVLQRECSGARHGNLEAIRRAYDVPLAAIRRM